jgi:hypothetical protein
MPEAEKRSENFPDAPADAHPRPSAGGSQCAKLNPPPPRSVLLKSCHLAKIPKVSNTEGTEANSTSSRVLEA